MDTKTTAFYKQNATKLAQQYESVDFTQIHKDWCHFLPKNGNVLDIGAGTGRDASYMAQQGLDVIAVEPVQSLSLIAQQIHATPNVQWFSDQLPDLSQVQRLQIQFDLILLCAVWMHIAPTQRPRSIRKLADLLRPGGKIVLTLRHGPCHDERTMYPVSAGEIEQLAKQHGLIYTLINKASEDALGRSDVHWETVVLTMPDDGTGAFPLIRNIVVNDSKASTYKLALLRTLLRIAEGQPGAAVSRNRQFVSLPMGLVALYWLKLYKPLVDGLKASQSPSRRGLGFVTQRGWNTLTSLQPGDFYIGAAYPSSLGRNVYYTLKDIATTIKTMPAKYIRLPGTKESVFGVELFKTQPPKAGLVLTSDFLLSLGYFHVPVDIWNALSRYSVWIEPALVNEWCAQMASYQINKAQNFSQLDYLQALFWDNPKRTTDRVRHKIDALLEVRTLACCWSGKTLTHNNYAVDHAFPFARWPNNDLWNLLPTLATVNGQKSDRLPSLTLLNHSRERVIHWWQAAWQESEQEFFTQANFALPVLTLTNRSFDDVFEALLMQRARIRSFQQLAEWGG